MEMFNWVTMGGLCRQHRLSPYTHTHTHTHTPGDKNIGNGGNEVPFTEMTAGEIF